MSLFKKLQENSMYWRYRFVTRRWLALKRWWRELRQPKQRTNVVRVRYRGVASSSAFTRMGGVDVTRGAAFVLALAAVWTALDLSSISQDGLVIGVLRVVTLSAIAYLFARFW